MRDLIWTIIIIWLVWKIINAFKTLSQTKTASQSFYNANRQNSNYTNPKKEGEVKIDTADAKSKPHFKADHGEYVDYEEVK